MSHIEKVQRSELLLARSKPGLPDVYLMMHLNNILHHSGEVISHKAGIVILKQLDKHGLLLSANF